MSRLTVHERQQVSIELRGIVTSILCTLIRTCGYTTRLIRHGRIGLVRSLIRDWVVINRPYLMHTDNMS